MCLVVVRALRNGARVARFGAFGASLDAQSVVPWKKWRKFSFLVQLKRRHDVGIDFRRRPMHQFRGVEAAHGQMARGSWKNLVTATRARGTLRCPRASANPAFVSPRSEAVSGPSHSRFARSSHHGPERSAPWFARLPLVPLKLFASATQRLWKYS